MHIRHWLSCLLVIAGMLVGAEAAFGQQPPDTVISDTSGSTASGTNALFSNQISINNSAFGDQALYANTIGSDNSAFGTDALESNLSGSYNVAFGLFALSSNTTGNNNSAVGAFSLFLNLQGIQNTASGYDALRNNVSGNRNNAMGYEALSANTASDNNAMGAHAMYSTTTGTLNNAVGSFAMEFNTTGNNNNAVGYGSLLHNTTGSDNSGQGYFSLANNTTGNLNIGIGYRAGINQTTGSQNIYLGNAGVATESQVIRIGSSSGASTQTSTYIAGINGTNVSAGVNVVVNSVGQLGVVSSSRRYKEDIQSMGDRSEQLLGLRPVSFRYKQSDEHGQKQVQYGLIAEEVAATFPELVVYNDNGEPETVRYQELTPLLLNEVQQQADQLADLKRQLVELKGLVAALAAKANAERIAMR